MRTASRIITLSASYLSNRAAIPKHSFTTLQNLRNPLRETFSGHFLKWVSVRTLSFASGFSPLKPKPLDSIIDIEKVKDRSPEDIASAWDDYHLGRGHIGTSMKVSLYHLLEHRAADCTDATHDFHWSWRLQGEGNSSNSLLHCDVLQAVCGKQGHGAHPRRCCTPQQAH